MDRTEMNTRLDELEARTMASLWTHHQAFPPCGCLRRWSGGNTVCVDAGGCKVCAEAVGILEQIGRGRRMARRLPRTVSA